MSSSYSIIEKRKFVQIDDYRKLIKNWWELKVVEIDLLKNVGYETSSKIIRQRNESVTNLVPVQNLMNLKFLPHFQ